MTIQIQAFIYAVLFHNPHQLWQLCLCFCNDYHVVCIYHPSPNASHDSVYKANRCGEADIPNEHFG